jgi:hypothetical protein
VRRSGRSFQVMMENSKITKRSRKYLKLRKASQDDADIDLECANIKVVTNRYSNCTPRQRESCLHRRPTERKKQGRTANPALARQITFGMATTIVTLIKGGDGRNLSLSETVLFAPRSESKINFSVKKTKVNTQW